jgi:transcriptional regulator with XRE-family HTH domain
MRTENKVTVKNSTLRNVTIKNGSVKNKSTEKNVIGEKKKRTLEIAEVVKRHREKKGVSIYWLAKQAGVSYSQLCSLEKADRSMSIEKLTDIALALDCRLDFVPNDAVTPIAPALLDIPATPHSKKRELFKTVFEDPTTKNVICFSA